MFLIIIPNLILLATSHPFTSRVFGDFLKTKNLHLAALHYTHNAPKSFCKILDDVNFRRLSRFPPGKRLAHHARARKKTTHKTSTRETKAVVIIYLANETICFLFVCFRRPPLFLHFDGLLSRKCGVYFFLFKRNSIFSCLFLVSYFRTDLPYFGRCLSAISPSPVSSSVVEIPVRLFGFEFKYSCCFG